MGDHLSFLFSALRSAHKPGAALLLVASLAVLTACQPAGGPAPSVTPTASDSASGPATGSSKPAAAQGSPTANASTGTAAPSTPPEVAGVELTTHTIAGGSLRFSTPSDWTLKKIALVDGQTPGPGTENILVKDAAGKTMAKLQTGFSPILHGDPVPGAPWLPFRVIEQQESALKQTLGSNYPENAFMFETLGQGNDIEGSLALGLPLAKDFKKLQYIGTSAVNGDEGLYFGRRIGPQAVLKDVDKKLAGEAKFKAYVQTDDYKATKAMLLSLKQTGKSSKAAPATTSETKPCLGKIYSYELEGSGLSCEEAKAFVQKLQDEGGGGAGGFDLVGYGICSNYDTKTQKYLEDHLICSTESGTGKFKIRSRM